VVTRRTREIGIRIALGARRGQVVRLVASGFIRAVLIGAAIGVAMTFASTRLLESLLFGVAPRDPMVFLTMTGAVVLVASISALVACRRAIGQAPLNAIRSE
ncbi:MAG TPA: FtsX-like permease family protein, partial [Vicinamibacterales bacterium]|nr:FtsX-like permease family protein [Vicinamibacterales bacterium]